MVQAASLGWDVDSATAIETPGTTLFAIVLLHRCASIRRCNASFAIPRIRSSPVPSVLRLRLPFIQELPSTGPMGSMGVRNTGRFLQSAAPGPNAPQRLGSRESPDGSGIDGMANCESGEAISIGQSQTKGRARTL